jgi:AbiU2
MHDAQLEHELEVFRTEAESGIQFFYAYLAVHAVAENNRPVYQLLNKAPLFWNTSLGALQTAAFIALGRVFDQNSTHNLDRLLRGAQDNPQLFSKAALGRRKQGANVDPPEWLEDYLSEMYEPTPQDFRRLRSYVRRWRKIYVELQRMFAFLSSLYEALWQLFFNGRKPVLRPQRYSVEAHERPSLACAPRKGPAGAHHT